MGSLVKFSTMIGYVGAFFHNLFAKPPETFTKSLAKRLRRSRSLSMLSQICYAICADELPGYAYFGTQYSNEVRSMMARPRLALRTFLGRSSSMQGPASLYPSTQCCLPVGVDDGAHNTTPFATPFLETVFLRHDPH